MSVHRQLFWMIAVAMLVFPVSSWGEETSEYVDASRYVYDWNTGIMNIIIEDSFSPAVAARIYAYSNIAAYEATYHGFPESRSLAGQINGLTEGPQPNAGEVYDWRVVMVAAYSAAVHSLLYGWQISDSIGAAQIMELKAQHIDPTVMKRSIEYGESVARHVLAWADADGYRKILARELYTIPSSPGAWEPTPPDFGRPVDPFINTVRTLTFDSVAQFKPTPVTPFSTDRNSEFFRQVMEVYDMSKRLTEDQKLVARYWDCNPIHTYYIGHLVYNERMISPGGHWINITANVCRVKKLPMMETLEASTLVSIGLFDAFLSAFDEKYRSNSIRPVTYINRYIDSTWQPYLQTPPFPEYTSAHSTISASAATILTKLFGEIPFSDDTEVRFGLPVRTFDSFMDAAREVTWSRIYGGIHYKRSCMEGTTTGEKIGNYVFGRINTRTMAKR